jgi:hypothetical protein
MSNFSIVYYLATAAGAFLLYFVLKSQKKPVIQFLPHINKEWAETTSGKIFEVVIFIFLGAIVGNLITEPINAKQALVAGLGWTGVLSSFTKV